MQRCFIPARTPELQRCFCWQCPDSVYFIELLIVWALIPLQTNCQCSGISPRRVSPVFGVRGVAATCRKGSFCTFDIVWIYDTILQVLFQVARTTFCDFCLVASSLLNFFFFFHISNSKTLVLLKQLVIGVISLLVSVFKIAFRRTKLNNHMFWGFSLPVFQSKIRCCTQFVFPAYLSNYSQISSFSVTLLFPISSKVKEWNSAD